MAIAKIVTVFNRQLVFLKTNHPSLKIIRESDGYTAEMELKFKDTHDGFDNRDRAFTVMSNSLDMHIVYASELDTMDFNT